MARGAFWTRKRTAAGSQSPAPAMCVSSSCSSQESDSPTAAAIPPCAQFVFESTTEAFVRTVTDPSFAASRAKVSPARPLPMTRKSDRSMLVGPESSLFWTV